MAFLGGADEIVVGTAQHLDHAAENSGIAVGQFDGRDPFLLGRLLHLLPMLVGACQEEDVLAVKAGKTGQDIRRDGRVGVADMRDTVGIEDRRGDVITGRGHDG